MMTTTAATESALRVMAHRLVRRGKEKGFYGLYGRHAAYDRCKGSDYRNADLHGCKKPVRVSLSFATIAADRLPSFASLEMRLRLAVIMAISALEKAVQKYQYEYYKGFE